MAPTTGAGTDDPLIPPGRRFTDLRTSRPGPTGPLGETIRAFESAQDVDDVERALTSATRRFVDFDTYLREGADAPDHAALHAFVARYHPRVAVLAGTLEMSTLPAYLEAMRRLA